VDFPGEVNSNPCMRLLRSLHLILGCFFAPLLLFYAVSGFWQVFGWQWATSRDDAGLALASTIHTGRGLKGGGISSLSSEPLRWFAAAMAVCLVVMIVTGLILALRSAKSKTAAWAIAVGLVIPLAFVLFAFYRN
jgi:hypothetical protein